MTYPWPKNEFPWPIGTAYFFEINDTWFMNAYQNKIFPVARRNCCHKIKPQVYVHVFTSISMLQNSLSNTTSLTALEILQLLLHFPWLSMTLAVFHDFPGLENGLTKFDDFLGRVVTLYIWSIKLLTFLLMPLISGLHWQTDCSHLWFDDTTCIRRHFLKDLLSLHSNKWSGLQKMEKVN